MGQRKIGQVAGAIRAMSTVPTAPRGLTFVQGWFPGLAGFRGCGTFPGDQRPVAVAASPILTVAGAAPEFNRLPNSPPYRAAPRSLTVADKGCIHKLFSTRRRKTAQRSIKASKNRSIGPLQGVNFCACSIFSCTNAASRQDEDTNGRLQYLLPLRRPQKEGGARHVIPLVHRPKRTVQQVVAGRVCVRPHLRAVLAATGPPQPEGQATSRSLISPSCRKQARSNKLRSSGLGSLISARSGTSWPVRSNRRSICEIRTITVPLFFA